MLNKSRVCQKVTELNPDIGVCGIDIDTHYSRAKKSWIIQSKKGDQDTIHFLDRQDLKKCLEDGQCVSLGLDVALLREY